MHRILVSPSSFLSPRIVTLRASTTTLNTRQRCADFCTKCSSSTLPYHSIVSTPSHRSPFSHPPRPPNPICSPTPTTAPRPRLVSASTSATPSLPTENSPYPPHPTRTLPPSPLGNISPTCSETALVLPCPTSLSKLCSWSLCAC